MTLSVQLPKTVRIKNRRLAIFHFSMVASLLVVLLYYKFYVWQQHYGQVPIVAALEVQWAEGPAIDGMQEFMARASQAQEWCSNAEEEESYIIRWGANWTQKVSCAEMCNLYDYLSHKSWSAEPNTSSCWASFKDFGLNQKYTPVQFMETRGPRDVSVITAKNDWFVDHAAQATTNYLEVVPQAKAAMLELGYSYRLEAPPLFFAGPLEGDAQKARTLLLDATGHPVVGPIPAGDPIRISMDDLWLYAERADGEAAQPLTFDVLGSGAEVRATASCFGDDRHLHEFLTYHSRDHDPVSEEDYGASLHDLVCAIRFTHVGYTYQIHASFDAQNSAQGEVFSETVGISIKVVGSNTYATTWDVNALLLQITSIIVLLAIPMEVTRLIATRLLGPLSTMYKRVVSEPYNIEEVAAATSTVLVQNIASFYQLSEGAEEGKDIIKLQAIQALMQRAFANTRGLSERELLALASFVYDELSSKTVGDEQSNTFLGLFSDVELDHQDYEESRSLGITLDQWNQCRLDCEEITFEALVKLFDKDRHRNPLELIFTPSKIKEALTSAMGEEETSKPGFGDFGAVWSLKSTPDKPTNSRALEMLHQSSTLGRKVAEFFSADSQKCRPMSTDLREELARLSERVRVVEEAMAGRGGSFVANEADGPNREDNHPASLATSREDTDSFTQLRSASAPGSASDSALAAAQPMPSPTDGLPERTGSPRAGPLDHWADMADAGESQSPASQRPAPPAAAASWPERAELLAAGAASGSAVHAGLVLPELSAPAGDDGLSGSLAAGWSADIASLTTARGELSAWLAGCERDLSFWRAQLRQEEYPIPEPVTGSSRVGPLDRRRRTDIATATEALSAQGESQPPAALLQAPPAASRKEISARIRACEQDLSFGRASMRHLEGQISDHVLGIERIGPDLRRVHEHAL